MHSSRMRTARLLTVSQHALPGVPAGGCALPGVYLPRGCTCPGGVPAQGGVPARGGVPAQGDVPAHGGVPAWGKLQIVVTWFSKLISINRASETGKR